MHVRLFVIAVAVIAMYAAAACAAPEPKQAPARSSTAPQIASATPVVDAATAPDAAAAPVDAAAEPTDADAPTDARVRSWPSFVGVDGGAPGLMEDEVRAGFGKQPSLMDCGRAEEKKHPDFSFQGMAVVKFTIEPRGTVSHVALIKSTVHNANVDACIVRVVKSWRFQASRAPTVVTTPMYFSPPGGDEDD